MPWEDREGPSQPNALGRLAHRGGKIEPWKNNKETNKSGQNRNNQATTNKSKERQLRKWKEHKEDSKQNL